MRLLNDDGRFLRGLAAETAPPDPPGLVERLGDDRYRASAERHGSFSVELPDREAALDAARVLDGIQTALAGAIAWGCWPDSRRVRPRTQAERYFKDMAAESRREARLLVTSLRPTLRDGGAWEDGGRSIRPVELDGRTALRVEVAEASLVLATHAATVDRAAAYLVLYGALQRDLRLILGWEPL